MAVCETAKCLRVATFELFTMLSYVNKRLYETLNASTL